MPTTKIYQAGLQVRSGFQVESMPSGWICDTNDNNNSSHQQRQRDNHQQQQKPSRTTNNGIHQQQPTTPNNNYQQQPTTTTHFDLKVVQATNHQQPRTIVTTR